jgi:hypothetical protein
MWPFKKRTPDKYEVENLVEEIYGRQIEEEISEIEFNAERVEAYEKMKSRKRRKSFLMGFAVFILLAALTLAVAFVGYRFLFIISDVKVVGDGRYTAEEICDGAGVGVGDALFSFSSKKAEAALMAKYPYIGGLEVERNIPDRVTLTVKYEEPVYYADIYGKIYLMSDTLRLLGEVGSEDLTSLIRLRLPGVKEAVLGSAPVFMDDDAFERLAMTASAVRGSFLADRINTVDLRNPFKLTMVCDGKYLLEFGDYTEVDSKLRVADAVLKDEMFNTSNKARINLSKLTETSVKVDNTLDLES